ncbi:MAG: hypothetical protein IKB99_03625, partial [Lentisphaeria bacterium]|nr:hypothetical protein [Lentisphaeria bacterium]
MKKCYSFRRITFEIASALHAGSGNSDPLQDMPIQLAPNGLPFICATSIAGVLRHLYAGNTDDLFGSQKDGGARIFIENAEILDENNKAAEGLNVDKSSLYLQRITRLVKRDHCAIGHQGSALKNHKFDRSVLIAGVRFICEFSIRAENSKKARREADEITALWCSPCFRLGGGTRNGFGRIKVLHVTGREYDLDIPGERKAFLDRSSSYLDDPGEKELALPASTETACRTYTLEPENFWMIAAGTEDYRNKVKITPKFEERVEWADGKYSFKEYPLLPATSIKGALAHRCAYHYNKLRGFFADKISPEEFDKPNPAVVELFGSARSNDETGKAGRVFISDIYCTDCGEKILSHVKIDRFTGGA